MPQGRGTYGTQVGRPPKRKNPKYQRGGMVSGMGGNRNMSSIAQSLINPFRYGFKGNGNQGGGKFQYGGEVSDKEAWHMNQGYPDSIEYMGVEVPTGHDNIDALIQANTLENLADFPRGESLDVLFKTLTQGGDTRYIGRNIPGLPTQGRTESISNNLQRMLNENPAYADTMSTEMAKQFMPEAFPGEVRNEPGMMERLMGLFGK